MTIADELMLRLFREPYILVVQDTAGPVEELLHRNYECHVDATDSGERAIGLLMEQRYDLVIIDMALLNGTSQKVLAAIQGFAPATPVVATHVDGIDFADLRLLPVTVLSGSITAETVDYLFRVFKIKARTREIVEYCAHRHAVIAAGA